MFAIEFSFNALGWRWFGSGKVLPILEVVALVIFIQKALNQKELAHSERGMPSDSKSRPALIEQEKMQAIANKLERVMGEEKAFLQEDLSLNKLSNSIAETENHISETLSQFLKTNFFQFVNGYRIEAAKRALKETDKQVTTIAYDVGFNSKSTFNTAFKKFVGLSPTAYRKSLVEP